MSVLAQSYQDFEIIVVNDGGGDVGAIVKAMDQADQIILMAHDEPKGAPAARNTGLGAAKGKYVAYLDDDDLYYPDHLATLVSFLESSDLAVAYTDACRAYQDFENGQYVTKKREVPYSRDFDLDEFLVSNLAPINCFMHARSCLTEVGLFDEALPPLEDWDFWIRLSRKFQFEHIRKVTCEVSWRTDGTSLTSARRADFARATRKVYEKHQELAKGKAGVIEAQKRTLVVLEAGYSEELRIQNLVDRLLSEKKEEDPLVRELLSLVLTLRDKSWEDRLAIAFQERKIIGLMAFVEKIRTNTLFKIYHWLKYRGRA